MESGKATGKPAAASSTSSVPSRLCRERSTGHPVASVKQPLGARATSADLPTVLIASTFPLEQIHEMMAAGHPFFAGLAEAEIIPLVTGHWPMLSEPKALADILAGVGCD